MENQQRINREAIYRESIENRQRINKKSIGVPLRAKLEMLCKRCECVWERARAGTSRDSCPLRVAANFFFSCFFFRALGHDRSSKNDNVSDKSLIYIASAELSFKSMALNISNSFAYNFHEINALIKNQQRINRESIKNQQRINKESIENQQRINRESIENQQRINKKSIENQQTTNRRGIHYQISGRIIER